MRRREFMRAMGCGAAAALGGQDAASGESVRTVTTPSYPGRTERCGKLKVRVGEIRIIMRGPMFPCMVKFADGSIVVGAASAEEHSELTSIRSVDGGGTWRPCEPGLKTGGAQNTTSLRGGGALSMSLYTKPIDGRPGWYATQRWESRDHWRTLKGPLSDGTLFLPPTEFDPGKVQWFHGNIVEMPDGTLLAAMQGRDKSNRFRTYLSQSTDGGKTWRYLSQVASLETVADPKGVTKRGWQLHGPCEPSLVHLGGSDMLCVMRLVNDDARPLIGPPMDTYRDLSYAVAANGIHPGSIKLPADKYFSLGPPSVPLIISRSSDDGRSWTQAVPMNPARGCWPRTASSDGILALTYGALAYPRWGNCITFSTDRGATWKGEVNFGPFLTTGYSDVVAIGAGKFLCIFDATPPQPWKNHAAHWVGAVDIEVT